ncbi:hypothetical protein ACOMHN_040630 [Nucella lapillus]
MASSATDEIESVEPKEYECSVCNEPFREPKLLPCGHLLCGQCLLTWMRTQYEARCPLCRDLIVGPQDRQGQSLEDLVSGLPTDLSMELILQADRILSRQHNCCVCEDVAATAMCINCRDMFCEACRKAHGKMSVSKHHVVEDLTTLTAEKVAASFSSPCATHPEETPRLFCPTHGASICLLCATSKHRSCPEVKDLEEKMEESYALLKQLTTTLVEGEVEFDKALKELDQHLIDIGKKAEAAIAEIEQMSDELDALVKENRHQLKDEVIKARSGIEEDVKEGRKQLLLRKGRLSTHRHTVRRAGEAKSQAVVTTMALKMEQRVGDLSYDVTLTEGSRVISTFRFIKNATAMTQIKQALEELGEVKTEAAIVAANRRMYVFHDNHGSSVTLSNGKRTASKSLDGLNGIVLSQDPMEVNVLYELLTRVLSFNQNRNNEVGAALGSLGEQHRVGLALDGARAVHLYVDGQDQGITAPSMPDPCYAMFDIVDEYEQITALPVTKLKL